MIPSSTANHTNTTERCTNTIEAKETYYRGKRDLLQRQKRPTIEAKETYYRAVAAARCKKNKS